MNQKKSFVKYASVILDLSIDKCLEYGLDATQAEIAKRGMRVEVPVKGHLRMGSIYSIQENPSYPRIQGISRLLSDTEVVTPDLFELSLWMAKYYCASLSETLKIILPAVIRKETKHKQQLFIMRAKTREILREHCEAIRNKASAQATVIDAMLQVKKGILLTELLEQTKVSRPTVNALIKQGYLHMDIVRVDRSPLINEEYFQTKPKVLNDEQAVSLNKICDSLDKKCFQTHLIYGVTGSGKTEIYLQAIDKALKMNRSVIMLIPEIALTAQTIERFRSRFEGKIAILHHRLSQGERFDEWHRIHRGEAQIVIGARSAIFSPVKDLGLIIVDEEHEGSYKQNEHSPCYHARDVAVMRGKLTDSTVILGSATPALESYYNAIENKYCLSTLFSRADTASIPKFTIVDMKKEFEKAKGFTNFSDLLLDGIKKRQERGEQTILFLNRRGYHTTLLCEACHEAVRCAHCDVSLTFHINENTLACHLCGYSLSPPPKSCPACHGETMKYRGVGTELIERSLQAVLSGIRTIRADADTTRHKGSHQRIFRDFASGKADVLIGTQMIAKGLHFPQVTLVGVLNSDTSLNLPDFRASETTFQLITQVAGRAGRGKIQGEVIVQTSLPENTIISLAAAQDYLQFYKEEIEIRRTFNYPPFASLIKITFSGPNEQETLSTTSSFRSQLLQVLPKTFEVYPAAPAGHAKIKDQFRFQLLIRGPAISPASKAISTLKDQFPMSKKTHMIVDVNPSSTFF